LRTAGCHVSTSGNDWLNAGNFDINREGKNNTQGYLHPDLTDGDIVALLEGWWPKSSESVPYNIGVNFSEIDKNLSLSP